MAEKRLKLPVLGLPFELGTLYNANKNQIVPSMPLWERNNINVIVTPRSLSPKKRITNTDSLVSKMQSLDIKGNLVISALCNKLAVKGSAEILKDNKPKTEAKIVLEVKGETEYQAISDNSFAKENLERYHEFIGESGATHVVVGITYGYQLFLILETACESEKENKNVQGKLESKIMFLVQGEVERSNKTNEEKKLNELKIKIHGSIQIQSNPTSLEEAIEIYQNIPVFATRNQCPLTVHLLPLTSICSSLPKACSQINESVLNSVTVIFEDIRKSEVALSGIQTSNIAMTEPRIRQKAKQLSAMLMEHKIWLQMKLYEVISNPLMDTESSKSKQIQNVLRKHRNSPFSSECFGIYVSKMEQEGCFLKNLMKMLTFSDGNGNVGDSINMNVKEGEKYRISIDILSDETDFLIPFERCKVFVLEVPIITVEDDLLKEMQKYDPDNNNEFAPCKIESWPFEDKTIKGKIENCAEEFVKLAHTYQNGDYDKRSTKFRCVFTGFEIGREPTINAYNASTGDIEPYYPMRLQQNSNSCELSDLQTTIDDMEPKRIIALKALFEPKC